MRIGLANEALPEDELSEMVDETAERLSQLSPASLAVTKKALYAWDSAHVDKGLQRAEQIYIEELDAAGRPARGNQGVAGEEETEVDGAVAEWIPRTGICGAAFWMLQCEGLLVHCQGDHRLVGCRRTYVLLRVGQLAMRPDMLVTRVRLRG